MCERTPGPSSPLAASVRHLPPRIGVCMVAQRGIGSREEWFRACKSSRQGLDHSPVCLDSDYVPGNRLSGSVSRGDHKDVHARPETGWSLVRSREPAGPYRKPPNLPWD